MDKHVHDEILHAGVDHVSILSHHGQACPASLTSIEHSISKVYHVGRDACEGTS